MRTQEAGDAGESTDLVQEIVDFLELLGRKFARMNAFQLVGIWHCDIRALSALIVRGVGTYSGVYKGYTLVIVSLRVCSGPQQTRSFSSEFTTKRKFQHTSLRDR